MPSADGSAVVERRAGSEPTLVSVRAKALMAPRAMRGRYFFFSSSDPKSLSGWGTPMDWCAESSAVRLASTLPSSDITFPYSTCEKPEAAVRGGDLHAEGAQPAQAIDHLGRILPRLVDLDRIDLLRQEGLELGEPGTELGTFRLPERIGMDERQPELPQEHVPEESGALPLRLARRLRDLPGSADLVAALLHVLAHWPPSRSKPPATTAPGATNMTDSPIKDNAVRLCRTSAAPPKCLAAQSGISRRLLASQIQVFHPPALQSPSRAPDPFELPRLSLHVHAPAARRSTEAPSRTQETRPHDAPHRRQGLPAAGARSALGL